MTTDWDKLWEYVVDECVLAADSIHGPSHWKRVEKNGLVIARKNGAVEDVVRLFSLFHDARRTCDGFDTTHGVRGAEYAKQLRGELFDLSDDHLELLLYACSWHTHGKVSDDTTIGTCWDADRLDLGRVGATPRPWFLSTEEAHKMVRGEG